MSTPATPGKLSQRAACARADISPSRFMKYVAIGRVRAIAEPGEPMRFNADDVARLATELKSPVPDAPSAV